MPPIYLPDFVAQRVRARVQIRAGMQVSGKAGMMRKMIFVTGAAFALAACGDVAEQASELTSKADAAIEGQGLVDAVTSAVNEEAVKGMAQAAASQALRDALPVEEMAIVGAVIDEEALMAGIDRAVDGAALGNAAREAVKDAAERTAPTPAE